MEEYTPIPDPLLEVATERFGIDFLFPYQRLVISNILRAAGVEGFAPEPFHNPVTGETECPDTTPHQIVILPTGAGKSLCFMLPAAMLSGPTLVIFPLLSLMADQQRRVTEAGMESVILRGGQTREERKQLWSRIEAGEVQMVLTNPETALQPETLAEIKQADFSHLVIDETHTVSEWGETFRPVYLEIGRINREAEIPLVTAFTATASELIVDKVKKIMFPDSSPNVITANPDRPNISYRVIPSICKDHDLYRLLDPGQSDSMNRPALVFCNSRTGAEMSARYLRYRLNSENIFFYHAGLSKEEKEAVEKWFFDSTDGVLCSTCAYGMGVDKKNIRTVIHRELPPSIESYLQESGRAGRDRSPAEAVLLFSGEERKRLNSIPGEVEKGRYEALLRCAEQNDRCRRESLLSLLGSEPEACFGCDVCSESVQQLPRGEGVIMEFIARYPRRYSEQETAMLLSGDLSIKAGKKRGVYNRFCNSLGEWTTEEIREAIKNIMYTGMLKQTRQFLWGNTLRKKMNHRVSWIKYVKSAILRR